MPGALARAVEGNAVGKASGHKLRVVEGQIVDADGVVFTEHAEPLEQVFQFAHVARPGVVGQRPQRVALQGDTALVAAGYPGQQLIGQTGDVLGALAQRWDLDGHDIESVVQVGAEAAIPHPGGQVGVGGGDDAYLGLARLAAQRMVLTFLQQLQQFGLKRQRQFAYLVEKQGAALGQGHVADPPVAMGAGEGAALVAEQLGFQ